MNYDSVQETQVLVIGQGLTGLRAAAQAAKEGAKVTVLGNGPSASPEIMGFNAVRTDADSVDLYYNDVIASGRGINEPDLAKLLVIGSIDAANDLESRGLSFDRKEDGSLKSAQPLGCSVPRLVQIKGHTGSYAMAAYRKECADYGAVIENGVRIFALLTENNTVCGAVGIRQSDHSIVCWKAHAVIIATGGCGAIHPISTYPKGICGDGYAMAFRAGCRLRDMEFMQFEPCCFIRPKGLEGGLAVTTMLLEGGRLLNSKKEEFITGGYKMQKSELALKISEEIRNGHPTKHGGVYYDITALPEKRITVDHEMFYRPALKCGIDLTKDYAEVAPAAHTCIGGIVIDSSCRTEIRGLYAAGEAAGGVHGANRIGGCSGSETQAFGKIAGREAACYALSFKDTPIPDIDFETCCEENGINIGTVSPAKELLEETISHLKEHIRKSLGICKNRDDLKELIGYVEEIRNDVRSYRVTSAEELETLIDLDNISMIADVQARASFLREESRGVFFRRDYPNESDRWACSIFAENNNGLTQLIRG